MISILVTIHRQSFVKIIFGNFTHHFNSHFHQLQMFNIPRFFHSEKTRKNPINLTTFTHALEADLPLFHIHVKPVPTTLNFLQCRLPNVTESDHSLSASFQPTWSLLINSQWSILITVFQINHHLPHNLTQDSQPLHLGS